MCGRPGFLLLCHMEIRNIPLSSQNCKAVVIHSTLSSLSNRPNWGDNPSPRGLNLMKLALEKFNRDWAQLKDKPDTYAWFIMLSLVGARLVTVLDIGISSCIPRRVSIWDAHPNMNSLMSFLQAKKMDQLRGTLHPVNDPHDIRNEIYYCVLYWRRH